MYQITRTRIVEQLEIDDNGTKTVLDVDISADAILKDYNQAQYAIAQAQMLAQKAKDEKDAEAAEQAMGEAILSLFKVIFGKDQLDKILQIYDYSRCAPKSDFRCSEKVLWFSSLTSTFVPDSRIDVFKIVTVPIV